MLPEEIPPSSSTVEATEQSTASDTTSLPGENSESLNTEKNTALNQTTEPPLAAPTSITTDKAKPKSLYEIREQLRQQNN